jgi:hypothetical protein
MVADVTKIERPVVEIAHRETVRMLYGLTPEQIETLLLQIRITKESGFLTSAIWDDPERVRRELFWHA